MHVAWTHDRNATHVVSAWSRLFLSTLPHHKVQPVALKGKVSPCMKEKVTIVTP